MKVTVLLFASLAEAAGVRRLEVEANDGETVAMVRDRVVAQYPALGRFVPNLMYALDETYANAGDGVQPGATLALIPPVSGGC